MRSKSLLLLIIIIVRARTRYKPLLKKCHASTQEVVNSQEVRLFCCVELCVELGRLRGIFEKVE